jgi:hypothetical protein
VLAKVELGFSSCAKRCRVLARVAGYGLRQAQPSEHAYYIAGRMQSPMKDISEEGLGIGEVRRDAGGGDIWGAIEGASVCCKEAHCALVASDPGYARLTPSGC